MLKQSIIALAIAPFLILRLLFSVTIYWVRYPAFWLLPSIRNPFAFVDVYSNIEKFLAECATEEPLLRGGFGFSCDGNQYITVNCARMAKNILSQTQQFPKNPLSYDVMMAPLLGKGLITSEGERWQIHNLAMKPYFAFPYLNQVLRMFANKSYNYIKPHSNQGLVDSTQFCTQLTLRLIISFIFGNDCKGDELAKSWHDVLYSFPPVAYFSKFAGKMTPMLAPHLFTTFYNKLSYLREQIEKEMSLSNATHTVGGESVLSRMASERTLFSKQDCIDHCMTFMFAGHDTTANTLAWVFYYLHQEEHVLQKVTQEAKQLFGVNVDQLDISAEKLHMLTYLRAVIMETLRRSPPILLLERVVEGHTSENIKPGAVYAISVFTLHHSHKYWKDPFNFVPERFVEESSHYGSPPPGAYIPFSMADRACLGKKMAIYELQIMILICILYFNWKVDASKMRPSYSPFYHPSNMRIQFEIK